MEKKKKLDKKLHQMLVDLAKVKANVLQIKMSEIAFLYLCTRQVFTAVLFGDGASHFFGIASKTSY